MASAPQLDLFPLLAPFHDQLYLLRIFFPATGPADQITPSLLQVFNKHLSLSIAPFQKKAVLDRLLEISFMFQQQYSAGRGIALTVSHKPKTGAGPSDSKRPLGPRTEPTEEPEPTEVHGIGGLGAQIRGGILYSRGGQNHGFGLRRVELGDLAAEPSVGGLIEGPHSVGELTFTEPLSSSSRDPYLEDIARYKRAPASDTECLNLDGLLDDLDDFALPAAEESDADSWHLSF
ncbi:hypothetical protein TWF281_008087 [Arthrobotrys megalospora]